MASLAPRRFGRDCGTSVPPLIPSRPFVKWACYRVVYNEVHLTRLPIAYFEKRHLGDIVSRFGSINSIQSTLTSLFVESLLDGLMALLAFVMILIYSRTLSLIVIAGVIGYAALRWFFYVPLQEASKERLLLQA